MGNTGVDNRWSMGQHLGSPRVERAGAFAEAHFLTAVSLPLSFSPSGSRLPREDDLALDCHSSILSCPLPLCRYHSSVLSSAPLSPLPSLAPVPVGRGGWSRFKRASLCPVTALSSSRRTDKSSPFLHNLSDSSFVLCWAQHRSGCIPSFPGASPQPAGYWPHRFSPTHTCLADLATLTVRRLHRHHPLPSPLIFLADLHDNPSSGCFRGDGGVGV